MSGRPQNKILVIRGGAIGDFVLTLPVFAALRRQFPDTELHVLGYAHIAQLARLGGLVDEVRSIEARALAGFFARRGELDQALQEYFASFAVIVSYLYDPDSIFQENVSRASKAQFLPGPHRPDDRARVHATRVFLSPLERLAIFDADAVPRLDTGATPQAKRVWAIHPGSGSDKKNWPEAKWAELIRLILANSDRQLLLTGGEAEEGKLERLAKSAPPARVGLACSVPLPELAKRLAQCHGFIGHDSGITHLAAAAGVPVIALWGDTAEEVWAPPGKRVTLIRAGKGLAELAVDTVARAMEDAF